MDTEQDAAADAEAVERGEGTFPDDLADAGPEGEHEGDPDGPGAWLTPDDLLGLQEIAELLGVAKETTWRWRSRHVLPEPFVMLSGIPIWTRDVVERWGQQTGRLAPPPEPTGVEELAQAWAQPNPAPAAEPEPVAVEQPAVEPVEHKPRTRRPMALVRQ